MSLDLIFAERINDLKERKGKKITISQIDKLHLQLHRIDFEGLLLSTFEPSSDDLLEVSQTAKELGLENSSSYVSFIMAFYHKIDSERAVELKDDLFNEFFKSE